MKLFATIAGFCTKHSCALLSAATIGTTCGIILTTKKAAEKTYPEKIRKNTDIDVLKQQFDQPGIDNKQTKKDIKKTKIKYYGNVVINYLPVILLTAAQVFMVVKLNKVYGKKIGLLSTALASSQAAYNELANRYRALNNGQVNAEKKKVDNKTVYVNYDSDYTKGPYSIFICRETSPELWDESNDIFFQTLLNYQGHLNNSLRAKKGLYLDDVLEELRICRSELPDDFNTAAHVLGWTYDKNKIGAVDFGLYDINGNKINPSYRIAGDNKSNGYWLTFNCDGDIFTTDKYTKALKNRSVK